MQRLVTPNSIHLVDYYYIRKLHKYEEKDLTDLYSLVTSLLSNIPVPETRQLHPNFPSLVQANASTAPRNSAGDYKLYQAVTML